MNSNSDIKIPNNKVDFMDKKEDPNLKENNPAKDKYILVPSSVSNEIKNDPKEDPLLDNNTENLPNSHYYLRSRDSNKSKLNSTLNNNIEKNIGSTKLLGKKTLRQKNKKKPNNNKKNKNNKKNVIDSNSSGDRLNKKTLSDFEKYGEKAKSNKNKSDILSSLSLNCPNSNNVINSAPKDNTHFIINNSERNVENDIQISHFDSNIKPNIIEYLNSHYITNVDDMNLNFFKDFLGIKEKINSIFRPFDGLNVKPSDLDNIKSQVNQLFPQYVKLLGFVHLKEDENIEIPNQQSYYNENFVFNVSTFKKAHELYRKLCCSFKLSKCFLYIEKFIVSDKPFFVYVSADNNKIRLKVKDYYKYNYISRIQEFYIDEYLVNKCTLIFDFLNPF